MNRRYSLVLWGYFLSQSTTGQHDLTLPPSLAQASHTRRRIVEPGSDSTCAINRRELAL